MYVCVTEGKRVGRILQALYPTPRLESKRVLTFANRNDFISFRHHMYTTEEGKVKLKEAGPRFEMQPYEVQTLDLYPLYVCMYVCMYVCIGSIISIAW